MLTVAGELVSVAEARARPWDVAAANWVATALAVAEAHPDALLIDVGSTTADIVPIVAGRVAATGHNDLERLQAGELVYTGVLRTNLAAIAPRVPVRGGWCPVSSEYFAISADVQLVLGRLTRGGLRLSHARRAPGHRRVRARAHRPAGVRRRRTSSTRDEIDAIAAYLGAEQVRQIEAAARRVQRPLPPEAPVVAAGSGAVPGARGRRAPGASGRRPSRGVGRDRRGVGRRRWPRCWRRARADRRQGRRRCRRRRAEALCTALGALGERHPLLVVPGGAGFADAVRDADRRFELSAEASHRMAILGMEQFGWLLSELIPGAERCADLARVGTGRTTVLLPAALPLEALPASWQVTSDSIAAWVATQAGAGRLVLVKGVDGLYAQWPARGEPLAHLSVAELAALRPGGVDDYLPVVLEGARFETWVIGAERVVELIERGTAVGTRIGLLP